MLTADLVRARRRGDRLELVALGGAAETRALALAAAYIEAAKRSVGQTRSDLDASLAAVPAEARDRKLAAGLRKLVMDRCELEPEPDIDPIALRREVFGRASAARRALGPGQRLDTGELLAAVADERGLDAHELERLLYVDLRGAHRVLAFASLSPKALVELYELGQAQAVLLRAHRVVARVYSRTPAAYRALFRKMKFLRLLHTIAPAADDNGENGYELVIDGPYSLFRSGTKYGLKLALLLPALRACDRWSIQAEVEWGQSRQVLSFLLSGSLSDSPSGGMDERPRPGTADTSEPLVPHDVPDEVADLLARFAERAGPWRARPASDILTLPGVGLCVPDLLFEHAETGECVYLEVLGFWSRAAVWQRVELVERGLPYHILFAVSSRLRVSEAALGPDLPGALYVYKGAMSARAVEQRLDALIAQPP